MSSCCNKEKPFLGGEEGRTKARVLLSSRAFQHVRGLEEKLYIPVFASIHHDFRGGLLELIIAMRKCIDAIKLIKCANT